MKLIKLMTGGAICAAAVFALGTIQAQNLLVDPGFESGTAVPSGIGGWAPVNGAAFSTTVARTGTESMFDNGPGGGFSVPLSFQYVSATAGSQYDLTGFGLFTTAPAADSTGNSYGALQITFWSGANGTGSNLGTVQTTPGNALVSNKINSTSPTGQWIALDTGIVTAPAGAQSAEAFTIVVNNLPVSAYFDDISLVQVVPEPSTLVLAGMALGIPFYFIRRRNS
jgi:PEP-CTERM motif